MTPPGCTWPATMLLAAAIALEVALPALAASQKDQCIVCHETEVLPISLGHSFAEWRASAHGRAAVGCEKCHGGNPRAARISEAHQGVLPTADAESMVHPTRLPATCGACHARQLAAYADTVHARELKTRGSGATCFTCHGAMATGFPSPAELSARCAVCHPKHIQVQAALIMLAAAKTQLRRTQRTLEATRAANPSWYKGALGRFHDLERDYGATELKWHTFKMDEVLQETRDLLKLAKVLDEEAGIQARRRAP